MAHRALFIFLQRFGVALAKGILILLACMVALVVIAHAIDPWQAERQAFRDATPIGASEEVVRAALGEPVHEYTAENTPADYYVDGYSFRERPISHKVLIYVGTEPICYVWLDEMGVVEDRFVGGS